VAVQLAPPEPEPVPQSPELIAFKAEIEQRAAGGDETHYQVLGIPKDAPATAIQSAFFLLAKRWHPDRLSRDFTGVRDAATRVFARMSEAHQVLSDPARRREYDDALKLGAISQEEQEQVQRVVQAVNAFQKAEVLLKRGNLAAAETEARRALELDASQADYGALVAWLDAAKPNPSLDNVLARLDKSVHAEPNNLKIRWYRGQVLNKLGKVGRARQDFQFIVENDPRHIDAQREIRLLDMRRSAPSPAKTSSPPKAGPSDKPKAPEGSLFGKWFKR
jgi:curved DNA-binding protein CbpA